MTGDRDRDAGFTLLEMLVVVAILAVAGTVVLSRGPAHSARADVRAAATVLSGALRLARSQAIAADAPVVFLLDPASRAWRIGDAPAHTLPGSAAVAAPRAGITFMPTGSSSGGRIDIGSGTLRMAVAVDWLTGRIATGGT